MCDEETQGQIIYFEDLDGKQLRIDIQLVTEETDYEIILDTELVDSTNVFLSAREGVGRQQGFPKYQIHDYEGVRNGKRCEGNQRFYCCRYFYKCL